MFAPVPRIADPLDDERCTGFSPPSEEEEEKVEDEDKEAEDSLASQRREIRRRLRAALSMASRACRTREAEEKKPTGFMDIPLEIREDIYRHILVVTAPILVRAGWKRIYARKRPGIETAILHVSKSIYNETTRILYGDNTFLYRLRDPTNRVANLRELPERDSTPEQVTDDDDEPGDDEFVPDDGDYDAEDEDAQEHSSNRPSRSKRRRTRRAAPNKNEKSDQIDIEKFGAYFRRLIVEAERNRFSETTQTAMAEAIKVFTAQPGTLAKACAGGVRTTINTFTIRVAPKYRHPDDFTFVDFFRPASPVWRALKSLPCRFIRIDILTAFLNGGCDPRFCRLTIDMQGLRFSRLAARSREVPGQRISLRKDFWQNDLLIGSQRAARANRCEDALEQLETHVAKACEKHLSQDVKEAAVGIDFDDDSDYYDAMDWDAQVGGLDDFDGFAPGLEPEEEHGEEE
ncbi:hypothetical protein B0T10DRAFT_483057 [Thelonectria olida]|uniref:Uncharacterized protein n=1 Tax=Thelonectria olida TaxID=1576542 RepID=A0A9P8W7K4_9HYPO|nr:hypothetical protein B0T10DRAFT_483057 [Thelonectria olida]